MHVTLSLKQGDHQGLTLHPCPASGEDPARCPACDPDPDPDPCIAESSSYLLPTPVRDFLVLPGSALAHKPRKLSISFVYSALFLLLLILLVVLF